MKSKIVITLLALCYVINLSAQKEETVFGNEDIRLSGIWISLDPSYAYFNDDFSYSYGFSLVGEISRTVLLGYIRHDFREYPEIGADQDKLDIYYDGFLLGYTPRSFKAVHPRVELAAGSGSARLGNESDRIFVIQPSLGVELNATQWCRLGLQAGYRLVTYEDFSDASVGDLSSPFIQGSIRFGISWGD